MSPVCGIFSHSDSDVSAQAESMMRTFRHEDSAGARLIFDGVVRDWAEGAGAIKGKTLGQVCFATRNGLAGQPGLGCGGRPAVVFEGDLYNAGDLKAGLSPDHKMTGTGAAEVTAHLIEKEYQGDLSKAVSKVAPLLDGEFCLAASDENQVVLMRDAAGRRPAFYSQDGDILAFASRKRALWEAGFGNVVPLRAGMMLTLSAEGVSLKRVLSLSENEIKITIEDLDTAVEGYASLLVKAVEKRLHDLDRVGVLVSGGVDSCLIAKIVADIAARKGSRVTVYTAGVEGSVDVDYAAHFAREMGYDHKVRKLSQEEVDTYIPRVLLAVEERDMVQVEAGIGIYAAIEMARQGGERVIFSGQGPDELWGGYTWYPDVVGEEGYEGLLRRQWGDLERADIETLDRENRIAMAHGVEKTFPYVDDEVFRLAMSVSPRLKITSAEDRVGKRPHREAAKRLGLPVEYADRHKDAAQHGTGIHDVLDAVARKNGFTPNLVARTGYNSEQVSEEKLASSTRYGYLYSPADLWHVLQHIQFYFDSVAYRNDLLNGNERSRIKHFLDKAGMG